MNQPDASGQLCIHIVDDEERVREPKIRGFEMRGLTAIGYPSGDAFLDAWTPDMRGVVSLDLVFPTGRQGDEVFWRLRDLRSHLPVVIHTGPHANDVPKVREILASKATVDYFGKREPAAKVRDRILEFLGHEAELYERAEEGRALLQAVAIELTTDQRKVVEGALEGLSYADIAAKLQKAPGTVSILAEAASETLYRGFKDPRTPRQRGEQFIELAVGHRDAVVKLFHSLGTAEANEGMAKELLDLAVKYGDAVERLQRTADLLSDDPEKTRRVCDKLCDYADAHAVEMRRVQSHRSPSLDTPGAAQARKLARRFLADYRAVVRNRTGNLHTRLARGIEPLLREMGARGEPRGSRLLSHLAAIEITRRLKLLDAEQHSVVCRALVGAPVPASERPLERQKVERALDLMSLDDMTRLRKMLKTVGQDLYDFSMPQLQEAHHAWLRRVLDWMRKRPDNAGFGEMPRPDG